MNGNFAYVCCGGRLYRSSVAQDMLPEGHEISVDSIKIIKEVGCNCFLNGFVSLHVLIRNRESFLNNDSRPIPYSSLLTLHS